jgi:hypothetical protein
MLGGHTLPAPRMRFRLEGEEVSSLYASGQTSRIPTDVRDAFFGVLEAIEAAAGSSDLDALLSVSPDHGPGARLRFPLDREWSLLARRELVDGEQVIAVTDIAGTVTDGG